MTTVCVEPVIGFRSRKAAQLCAWFATHADGCIEKLKLIELVYLSERTHLSTYEDSMLRDELYSLPHGPICSSTLDGINGVIHKEIWDDFIARNGNIVVSMKKFSRSELDDLSDIEIDIAEEIWSRFRNMTASQIRNYTHKNCPEYTEIESGRLLISYRDVLKAVGSDNADIVEQDITTMRKEEKVLTQSM
jgi:uncharacterized phage-associated protein